MNKRGIIKFILLIISFILTLIIYNVSFNYGGASSFLDYYSIILLFTLTLFMYYMRKKIKGKIKIFYNVILLLLSLVSIIICGYIIVRVISQLLLEGNLYYEPEICYYFFLCPILIMNIIIAIPDLRLKSDKTNDVLSIITSIIIILTIIIFYVNSSLNSKENFIGSDIFGKYIFIIQNYIYYAIMYGVILIHKLVNKN